MIWQKGSESLATVIDQQKKSEKGEKGGESVRIKDSIRNPQSAITTDGSGRKEVFDGSDRITKKDPNLYLLGEGIKRNPTNWSIWRQMGWAAFFNADQDPNYYLPLALQAMENARRFRPHSPQQQLEYGIISLSAY